jgi:hypothetical protein
MAREKGASRLSEFEPRLLIIFLFIAIPVTLIGSLLILGLVRSDINKTIGSSMAAVAADTARYLDSYILHNVSTVSALSVAPTIVNAAIAANHRYPGSEELIRDRLLASDNEWQRTGGITLFSNEIVSCETAVFLREVMEFKRAYREIMLTDVQGALIAATNITTDYYQADEPWWRQAYGDGENGSIFLSNVRFDQSAQTYALEVAVPVREKSDENTPVVVGVLKAIIAASDLFSVVGAVRAGDSGHALLLNAPDGTVITGDNPKEVMQRKHLGMALLNEALSDGRSSFVYQHEDGRSWLAGFSRMPEPSPSPELNWFVVVEQLLDEAQAPTSSATKYMVTFFAVMAFMVIIFSLYMHFRLVRPIRQVDLREEMERLTGADSESS